MLILCRRNLADKGTKKGISYGGNRKMSGYSWVWFVPGRTGAVRGHSTQQGFFLRAKRLLGRGWTWREKDIRTGGARGRQTVVLAIQSKMLARADKNRKAELREKCFRARTDGTGRWEGASGGCHLRVKSFHHQTGRSSPRPFSTTTPRPSF